MVHIDMIIRINPMKIDLLMVDFNEKCHALDPILIVFSILTPLKIEGKIDASAFHFLLALHFTLHT